MLHKLKNRKEEGFTIIEVLIVLAIAGLIIAIVLFAVPALQRNGRNTGIKSDAGQLAGYVSDYAGTYDGAKPAKIAMTTTAGIVQLDDGLATPVKKTTGKIQGSTTIDSTTVTNPASPGTVAAGTLYITFSKTCENTSSARAIAITYVVEGSGGTLTPKCVDA
jgi:prepilin-type N-terminal cleavage/methylation domain-containing protein